MNYYNEHEPKAAAWLRELIDNGHIPPGHVDSRDIQLVQPDDLVGFTQCHFFCGIAGWPLALQLAGWPTDRPVWTGSCPCQPFSVAGKGRGKEDSRHLWPQFRRLIRQCRPPVVFGEQVASAAGRVWLSGVCSDLEALGYCTAGADLCAAGGSEDCEIGLLRGDSPLEWQRATLSAPHIRQRLWWCAGRMAYGKSKRWNRGQGAAESNGRDFLETSSSLGGLAYTDSGQCGRLPAGQGCQPHGEAPGWQQGHSLAQSNCPTCHRSPWSSFDIIPCRDAKARRIESGTFPLAHGIPGRVGLLRGYGNAIVPQVAAQFIQAAAEALKEQFGHNR